MLILTIISLKIICIHQLLEKIVIIAILLITLVGVWTILVSEYKQIDMRYFDDPGYIDTDKIA